MGRITISILCLVLESGCIAIREGREFKQPKVAVDSERTISLIIFAWSIEKGIFKSEGHASEGNEHDTWMEQIERVFRDAQVANNVELGLTNAGIYSRVEILRERSINLPSYHF